MPSYARVNLGEKLISPFRFRNFHLWWAEIFYLQFQLEWIPFLQTVNICESIDVIIKDLKVYLSITLLIHLPFNKMNFTSFHSKLTAKNPINIFSKPVNSSFWNLDGFKNVILSSFLIWKITTNSLKYFTFM